jgi:hypothetical protein
MQTEENSTTQQLIPSPYFIAPSSSYEDWRNENCFSVYKRSKNGNKIAISLNFSCREDAEMLICELAEGKISEKEARKQSSDENREAKYYLRPLVQEAGDDDDF